MIALIAALVFSGCSWKGEGKNVAAAIAATSSVKSRTFTGSMTMDMSRMKGPTGATGVNPGDPTSVTMTFSGATDASDPAKPKMLMKMSAEGFESTMVAPGDGKLYMTSDGRSYSVPVPAQETKQKTIDPQRIYVALGDAVGKFQQSPPITNAQGKSVATIGATVDKKQLCGPVLDAFGEVMSQSSGLAGGLTTPGGAGDSAQLNKSGEKMMRSFCQMMLKSDPRVWFGIDDGKLTDVALTAQLTVPFAGPMGIEVQYHEYNQDQPQKGFDAPAGATPLGSFEQLPQSQSSLTF